MSQPAGREIVRKPALLKLTGFAFTAACLLYITRIATSLDLSSLQTQTTQVLIPVCLVSLCLQMTLMILVAYAWKLTLELVGDRKIELILLLPVFGRSNFAKYLPFGVFQFIARNFLGKELGFSHQDIALSSALEIILETFIFLILALILIIPAELGSATVFYTHINPSYSVIGVSIVFVLSISIAIFNRQIAPYVLPYRQRFLSKRFLILLVKLFVIHGVLYMASGLMLSFIYSSISAAPVSSATLLPTINAFILASFAGYIVPGAPGGLGIREFFLLLLLTPIYPDATTLTATVLAHRIIAIVADVCFYLSVFLIEPRKPPHSKAS